MPSSTEIVSAQMELLIDVQTELIPALRQSPGFPKATLDRFEERLELLFNVGERSHGRGPSKGRGGRPRKVVAA